MNKELLEQQMMQPYVIEIFESFVTSFYTTLYDQLINEMNNPQFSAELMEQQLHWKKTLQPVLNAQFEINISNLSTIENISKMKNAYIQIAQSCAQFQFDVSELLQKHFPNKFPDYFFSAHRLVEEKMAAQRQVMEQAFEQKLQQMLAQHDSEQRALQKELEECQEESTRALEKIRSLEQNVIQQQRKEQQQHAEMNDLQEQNVALVEDNKQLAYELEQQANVQQQLDAFQLEHRALQAQLETQHIEDNQLAIDALQQKIELLEGELSQANGTNDIQQAFERLKDKYDTDTAKLKAHINELMAKQMQISKQETTPLKDQPNEEIVALEKKLAQTEHQLEYFRKKNEQVVQQYLELLNNQ